MSFQKSEHLFPALSCRFAKDKCVEGMGFRGVHPLHRVDTPCNEGLIQSTIVFFQGVCATYGKKSGWQWTAGLVLFDDADWVGQAWVSPLFFLG